MVAAHFARSRHRHDSARKKKKEKQNKRTINFLINIACHMLAMINNLVILIFSLRRFTVFASCFSRRVRVERENTKNETAGEIKTSTDKKFPLFYRIYSQFLFFLRLRWTRKLARLIRHEIYDFRHCRMMMSMLKRRGGFAKSINESQLAPGLYSA